MDTHRSQLGQDYIVDAILHGKRDGVFLDIGASYAQQFSNSFFFEKDRDWYGLAVELNPDYQQEWRDTRPNSTFLLADATQVNYERALDALGAPHTLDFLSIDIDPPLSSWHVLELVMQTSYEFNAIAFEVDYGGDTEYPERFSIRDPSRELLRSKGYTLIQEVYDYGKPWYHVDDIWVNALTLNQITQLHAANNIKVIPLC